MSVTGTLVDVFEEFLDELGFALDFAFDLFCIKSCWLFCSIVLEGGTYPAIRAVLYPACYAVLGCSFLGEGSMFGLGGNSFVGINGGSVPKADAW